MNRFDFFIKLGVGAALAAKLAANTDLKALKSAAPVKVAIDFQSILFPHIEPKEILKMYYNTGVLLYDSKKGHPPIPLEGTFEEMEIDSKPST